jgi:hypothetical protein
MEWKAAYVAVTAIAFDPARLLLLTGTEKGLISIWDLKQEIAPRYISYHRIFS